MKSLAVHGALAVLGLILAYRTRFTEDDAPVMEEGVTIAACQEDQLSRVRLVTETMTVDIRPGPHPDDQRRYWVSTLRKERTRPAPRPKPKGDKPPSFDNPKQDAASSVKTEDEPQLGSSGDASTDTADEASPTPPGDPVRPPKPARPMEKRFLGNDQLTEKIDKMTPVRAIRSLGMLNAKQASEFGLDKPDAHLLVECAGKKLDLQVGKNTYGKNSRYVRDTRDQKVYLFDGDLISSLLSAELRLMQRSLHSFPADKVRGAVVTAAGKERKLKHRDYKLPKKALWVDAERPDQLNEMYGTWMGRVDALRTKVYLAEGAKPGADLDEPQGSPEPVLTLTYDVEGRNPAKLELARVAESGGTWAYYARTELTGEWVRVHTSMAERAVHDLKLVVGADESGADAR